MADSLSRLSVLVRQLQSQLKGKTVQAGTAVISTAAAVSGTDTVSHGMVNQPSNIQVTVAGTTGVVNATISNLTATTFDITVRYTDDSPRTADNTVHWLALG